MNLADENDKIYVVTPTPMMEWMKLFVKDSLKHPENVVLVPSRNLNPEDKYYYQHNMVRRDQYDRDDPRKMVTKGQKCEAKSVG